MFRTITCKECGKAFVSSQPKAACCSISCKSKYQWKRRLPRHGPFTCKNSTCGRTYFTPRSSDGRTYCSRECSFADKHVKSAEKIAEIAARRKLRAIARAEKREAQRAEALASRLKKPAGTCIICNKEMFGRKRRMCSPECKKVRHNATRTRAMHPCPSCGDEIRVERGICQICYALAKFVMCKPLNRNEGLMLLKSIPNMKREKEKYQWLRELNEQHRTLAKRWSEQRRQTARSVKLTP